MEILDIVDENGIPTGKTTDRITAHKQGLRHRTSHVWIVRKKENSIQVLLQKRSDNKDSYPGCYDTSSAGHIPAGDEFLPSALRELEEELGVCVNENDLFLCGQRKFQFRQEFYGETFQDNQVSNVYLLWLNKEASDFTLQKEEVSEVRWFELSDCMNKVQNNEIPNCIFMEELEMVKEAVNNGEKWSEENGK